LLRPPRVGKQPQAPSRPACAPGLGEEGKAEPCKAGEASPTPATHEGEQNAVNSESMDTNKPVTPPRLTLDALKPLRFLGAGAFANGFMCRHEPTGEVMALKCILKALVLKKKKQKQVIAEKHALMCPPHPCIVRLFATFMDSQHLYFAMELALGGELFALLEEKDALPEQAVRYYAGSVTLALGHLHFHGFIYRDLKPENLLLDEHGHLKLCDLGLAKRAERTYSVVGTPQYLAPELLRGDGATSASDWWALGVLIFEMLSGSLPFVSPDGSDSGLFSIIKRGEYKWPVSPIPLLQAQGGGASDSDPSERPRRRSFIGSELASALAQDLVAGLLRQTLPPPPSTGEGASTKSGLVNALGLGPMRIGSGPLGGLEVRSHAWFAGFDFELLRSGEHLTPYVPKLRGKDDDANFGPICWRGEPIMSSPDYDAAEWDALWDECNWTT